LSKPNSFMASFVAVALAAPHENQLIYFIASPNTADKKAPI